MSKLTTILITGLTMPASKRLAPKMDTVAFGNKLDASIQTLSNIPTLDVHRFDLDHEAEASSAESVEAFKKALRERQYDAYLIGAGLKNIPPLTPLFELLVNEIVSASDGKAKLLFSTDGADHMEVVKRGFPNLKEA